MRKKINTLFFMLMIPIISFAQEELLPINAEANIIKNAASLNPFFERLSKSQDSIVSIFHFGDSHIQADFFTGEIRKQMQLQFGNAGRGLVFPYQLISTNGPKDYAFKSKQSWDTKKLIKSNSTASCGLAGYSFLLDPNKRNWFLDFTFKEDSNFINNHTKTIQFLYEAAGEEPEISAYDAVSLSYAKLLNRKKVNGLIKDSFVFSEPIKQIDINIHRVDQEPVMLDGIILSNGEKGVIYHAVGVNGAKFCQYNQAPKFFEELDMLRPDLVVISLGTNESAGDYDSLLFIQTIDSLVQYIQSLGSNVLITTPANNFLPHKTYKYIKRKGKKRRVTLKVYEHNEIVKLIKDNILAYCDSRQIACWDLYEVMGGDYSMKAWVDAGKGAKDYLHFSKGGYVVQGKLFYDALSAAYLKHISK
ncbi:MAG: hypothetical protein Q8M15_11760 [Bacteroidota bacterium]|nr:hypothetical protein [Bacteroidota bacterium]